jgi:hypothetical protein
MKIQPSMAPKATPQIKVRTALVAGETCQQQVQYWKKTYNQLYRDAKKRGCVD